MGNAQRVDGVPPSSTCVVHIERPVTPGITLDPPAHICHPPQVEKSVPLGRGVGGIDGVSARDMQKLVVSPGYKYKKYGTKVIKGVRRHYYKCSEPHCPAKKYVEFVPETGESSGPHVMTTVTGTHSHLPHPTRSSRVVCVTQERFIEFVGKNVGSQMDPDDPANKTVEVSSGGQSFVVTLAAPLDHSRDGMKWRNYGKKDDRSYYRCVSKGCPVKKMVDDTDGLVTVSYSGYHEHNKVTQKKKKKKNKQKTEGIPAADESAPPPPRAVVKRESKRHKRAPSSSKNKVRVTVKNPKKKKKRRLEEEEEEYTPVVELVPMEPEEIEIELESDSEDAELMAQFEALGMEAAIAGAPLVTAALEPAIAGSFQLLDEPEARATPFRKRKPEPN